MIVSQRKEQSDHGNLVPHATASSASAATEPHSRLAAAGHRRDGSPGRHFRAGDQLLPQAIGPGNSLAGPGESGFEQSGDGHPYLIRDQSRGYSSAPSSAEGGRCTSVKS